VKNGFVYLLAIVLITTGPLTVFAAKDAGFAVKYDGGSIADLKSGTDMRINPAGTTITL
jgi:hypothetical protein